MMPEQPTKADLCPPFNGNMTACKEAATACWEKDKFSTKETMIKCVHARAPKRPTESKLAARADLPTEAELCAPFNNIRHHCMAATRACYEKDRRLMSSKKALIKCVQAAAAAAAERPTDEELCAPFNGDIQTCGEVRAVCAYRGKLARKAMIKCVHDIVAERPKEAELCPLFDKLGGRNFCIEARDRCLLKYYTKVEILQCAHDIAAAAAIANQITDEELCLPFNGDKGACRIERINCIKRGKLTRKAMIKCVHDGAGKLTAEEFDDSPIWSL
ncbi:metallothionein-I transcription activator [Metarhizium robertsii ARSEF 23]|uniref:Metallothionein-I transcription activator n=1 Tax=Metarhizium robertsii (strain ARSEF 23 / ATCC MYA-3075) TaxID=655844 RepID=A0A0B2XH78_METRA|nr:metallothionein-I transcription activator [Metarhizium robertsii ARSEF 23]KHO11256.1 metallothionein-I transcription activator [Metarhizium robertsii ARSEF 23]